MSTILQLPAAIWQRVRRMPLTKTRVGVYQTPRSNLTSPAAAFQALRGYARVPPSHRRHSNFSQTETPHYNFESSQARRRRGSYAFGTRLRRRRAHGRRCPCRDVCRRPRRAGAHRRHRQHQAPHGLRSGRRARAETSQRVVSSVLTGVGASRLVWLTDVLPDTLADVFAANMEKGLAVVKRQLKQERT